MANSKQFPLPKGALEEDRIALMRELERDGNPGLLAELTLAFTGDSRNVVAKIRQALALRQLEVIRKESHALSSMAGGVGAERVRLLASTLEGWAKGSGVPACPVTANQLGDECEHAISSLQEISGTKQ